MMEWHSKTDALTKTLLFICAVAFLLRLAFALTGLAVQGGNYYMTYSDSWGYVQLAHNLLDGHGFSMSSAPPYEKESIRVPGYPLFLAASFALSHGPWLAILLQVLIGAATPLLLYEVLRRLSFSRGASLFAAGVMAFEPLSAAFAVFLTSETLFIFVFFLSLLFYLEHLKNKRLSFLITAALLWGAATLLRPIALYTFAFFVLHFVYANGWRNKETWKRVLSFALVASATLLPWMLRNLAEFDSLTLSAVPYYNAYVWHGGSIIAVAKKTPFDIEREKLENDLKARGFGVMQSLGAKGYMKQGARKIILEYPVAFLKLDTLNSWKFFTMDGYYDLATHLGFYKSRPASPLSFLDLKNSLRRLPSVLASDPMFFLFVGGRLAWIVLFPVFLLGAVLSLRRRENRARDILLLFIIFYFMAASLSTGFGMNARFRLPIASLYLAYIALGAQFLFFLSSRLYHRHAMSRGHGMSTDS